MIARFISLHSHVDMSRVRNALADADRTALARYYGGVCSRDLVTVAQVLAWHVGDAVQELDEAIACQDVFRRARR